MAKNFRVSPEIFATLSQKEKYIFQGTMPGSLAEDRKAVHQSRHRFTHRMLAQEPMKFPGGTVRITDSTNFPISKTTAAAHVTIVEGGLREMHWHPNADGELSESMSPDTPEWSFFLKGHARVTIFAANGAARTFNYVAGDVGIVPKNHAHYVENIGEGEVEMLEMFRASKFEDFSTEQWLANTPGNIVAEHLNLEGEKRKKFLSGLNKDKVPVKPGMKEKEGKVKKNASFSDFEDLRL